MLPKKDVKSPTKSHTYFFKIFGKIQDGRRVFLFFEFWTPGMHFSIFQCETYIVEYKNTFKLVYHNSMCVESVCHKTKRRKVVLRTQPPVFKSFTTPCCYIESYITRSMFFATQLLILLLYYYLYDYYTTQL